MDQDGWPSVALEVRLRHRTRVPTPPGATVGSPWGAWGDGRCVPAVERRDSAASLSWD